MRRRRRKVRKPFFTKKKVIIFITALIVILGVSFFSMIMGGLFSGNDEPEEIEEIVEVEKGTGKVNFLVVGVDKEASLTDTIMVVSYDLDEKEVNILSIPRDTRMYVGSNYQKINSAYTIRKDGKRKGINGTIEAVSRLTKIPLNFYVEVGLDSFREIIDDLGGVYYDVPQDMYYVDDTPKRGFTINLKKGYQLLDGDKAEQLIRFRKYPMGDIARTKVQQSFIKALADQKLNISIIEKLPDLYKTISKNIKTNLELSDVIKYMPNLMELSSENVHFHNMPGQSNNTDYGSSYWIVNIPKLQELVKNTFGYDAEGATIHSADGSSISKDVKITPSPSPTASVSPEPSGTPKASATPKPTQKATTKPVKTSIPLKSIEPEKTTEETKAPAETPKSEKGGIVRPPANKAD